MYKMFIYLVTNLVNGKQYVGKTHSAEPRAKMQVSARALWERRKFAAAA